MSLMGWLGGKGLRVTYASYLKMSLERGMCRRAKT